MTTPDTTKDTTAVILAAGLGTRMKSAKAKVLHEIAGRPMVSHLMATLADCKVTSVIGVIGQGMEDVAATMAPHPTVLQTDRLGTAHAVLAARDHLSGLSGDLLVLYGDTPLIPSATIQAMLDARRSTDNPGVVVLGFRPDVPGHYGRLICDNAGHLERIVEAKEASPEELNVTLCNSGVMAIDAAMALGWLDQIDNNNAKGEYYLTDLVALARRDGRSAAVVEGAVDDLIGVNSRVELAEAEAVLQSRLRVSAMEAGVTLQDPISVYFSFDTKLAPDVVIEPHVVFGPGVVVEAGSRIRAFSHLENCRVGKGVTAGPYARLRPGADIGDGAHIGNFVEVKKATVEAGAKVNHLSYIGDARVGAGANIGAGTITCNYDGYFKSLTDIGAGAFIGSNTSLVAPVKIGDGAIVGAGSVITRDVEKDAVAVARGNQVSTRNAASIMRKRKEALKAKQNKS